MPKGYGGVTFNNGQLDQLWPVVGKSKVRMVRIGGNAVETNVPTGPEYVALIDSIRRIGAEPMVQVAQGRGKYTAQQAAALVDYVNNTRGRRIKYWSIGNEPDLVGGRPTVDAAGVAAYIKAWSTAMKAVDPSILIVGPDCSYFNPAYYPALLGGVNDITGQDANGRYYVDVISFHYYPFSGGQTRAQVLTAAQNLTGTVNQLLALLSSANAKNNRTGTRALQWALTEFNINYINPTANTTEGVGVQSFLNGQFWTEVFGVGMQKQALTMLPWSIHESSGARTALDLGYLDGSGAAIKPRSSYYHEMLVAENLRGTFLPATTNQPTVTAFGSTHGDTTAVLLLNKNATTDYDFTVQLSAAAVPGAAALKVNVPAGLSVAYSDKLFAQSTLVLLFDNQGVLKRKIIYSLQQAINALPPRYLAPGQNLTLAVFSADKKFTCLAPEQVTYSAAVLGNYTALSWNFGAGASPQTATGKGPVAVTYATPGTKTVSLAVQSPDTSFVVTRPDYVRASTCVRTPYPGVVPAIPGVVKAVEFDNGGEGVAYHDTDPANQGALVDPTVPRADEGVDTENGGEGNGNVGYTASGEWLRYSVNVTSTGFYKVTLRLAANTTGGTLRLSLNDVDKTSLVTVPSTSSPTAYQDVVVNNVYLEAGATATLQVDIVSGGFNLEKFTFAAQDVPGLVVNRVYNATNDGNGSQDAVELLVVRDHLDARNLVVKDFEANNTTDNGGKYRFNNLPFWSDLRRGTTIVLRRLAGPAGYAPDLDATDYTLDLLLDNATYLTNLDPANSFNITQYDMVLIKSGPAAGVSGAIHAFATRGGGSGGVPSPLFQAVTSAKLVSPDGTDAGAGSFHYPLNPTQSTSDYDGVKGAISKSTAFNWGYGFGQPNIDYIQSLRNSTAVTPPGLVVNRVYNATNDGNGSQDAVELLVVQDHLDARNLVVKDFEANNTTDDGGKYRFNNLPFWSDLRRGTTIVLRRLAGPAGYAPDLDATDYTLDLLLDNATYLTNLDPANSFNITQYDMVLIKSGPAAGVDGAIHAFATKGGGAGGAASPLFQAVTSAKLVSPDGTDAGGGTFHYPLNPAQNLSDYNGLKGAISKSTDFNWGYGFGEPNVDYIQSLRNGVVVTATRAALAASAVGLYPNPAHGSFIVLLPPLAGQPTVRATLLNSLGQVVLSRTIALTAAGATAEFATQALAAGVYTLRLQSDDQTLTKRVVLEQ